MRLTLSQIRDYAASVGFPDPDLMAAIAMAESQGYTTALNDTRNKPLPPGHHEEYSVGLWQINMLNRPGSQYTQAALTDPVLNAQIAYQLSNGGKNLWGPWYTTMKYGRYLKWYSGPVVVPPESGVSSLLGVVGAFALTAGAGFAAYQGLKIAKRKLEPVFP